MLVMNLTMLCGMLCWIDSPSGENHESTCIMTNQRFSEAFRGHFAREGGRGKRGAKAEGAAGADVT